MFAKFWLVSEVLGQCRNPRFPPFVIHVLIGTSNDVIITRCEPQRKYVWTHCNANKFRTHHERSRKLRKKLHNSASLDRVLISSENHIR